MSREAAARTTTSESRPQTTGDEKVLLFKRRMLEWSNPVEYVNNMYGCHPGDDNTEYFSAVFAR